MKGRACLPSTMDTAAEREERAEARRIAFLKGGGREVLSGDLRFGQLLRFSQLEGFEYNLAEDVVVKRIQNAAADKPAYGAWFDMSWCRALR